MNGLSTKRIILNGIMIALVFLATFFTRIPIPMTQGYFNIGDTVIIVTAIVLGKKSGLLVGAIGSFIADIAAGYYLFAPITLIVKGMEGFTVGAILSSDTGRELHKAKKVFAVACGSLVMVAGYFIGEAYILRLFDSTFGFVAAIAELPLNLLQGGISAVIAYSLSAVLEKVNIRGYVNIR